MGNSSVIEVGDVQRTSAGAGVRHREFNASETERALLPIAADRRGYVHLAGGATSVGDTRLDAGDAIAFSDVQDLEIHQGEAAEVLVFDVPGGQP
jgi:redox-sensitive bicupin YhaK (pirin superfamily)